MQPLPQTSDLIPGYGPAEAARFGSSNILARHRLHTSPLFSEEKLMRLIEATPRDRYHVNTPAPGQGGKAGWREGEIGKLSGERVFEAVRKGALWVHLQRVGETDPAYAELLDAIFAEIEAKTPGLATYKRSMSVLISSPNVEVAYHCDVPGQMLWQISGRKKIWIYPNRAPFLPQESLENIVLKRTTDTDLAYESCFDEQAAIYDLTPGDVAHWPLNGPHRVVNEDCLNISFTTEHWTDGLRDQYAANYANGLLRQAFGLSRLSRETTGPRFYAKMALAGAHKKLAARNARALEFKVDFRVDPDAQAGIRDIPARSLLR